MSGEVGRDDLLGEVGGELRMVVSLVLAIVPLVVVGELGQSKSDPKAGQSSGKVAAILR